MKIKNSVRKKLLASLLIGLTLSGTVTNSSFALNSSAQNSCSVDGSVVSASLDKLLKTATTQESRDLLQQIFRGRTKVTVHYVMKMRTMFIEYGDRLYAYQWEMGAFIVGLWTFAGDTYYFDKNNFRAYKGWANVNGGRYYFNPQTWKACKNGVYNIDGSRYLFDSQGRIMKGVNTTSDGTYYTDNNGKIRTGWYTIDDSFRYFFNPNDGGRAYTGWYHDNAYDNLNGAMYFHSNGRMAMGLTNINGDLYLFQPHGKGQNYYRTCGYYSTGGDRYYFDQENSGKAAKDKWYQTGRGWIHFNSDCRMSKGVNRINGKTFVFTQSYGRDYNYYRALGWYTDKSTGKRYYFGGYEGEALTGYHVVDGKSHYFNYDGSLQV